MEKKKRKRSKRYKSLARKTDEQLVELLQGDDPRDIDTAMQVFHDRYNEKLKRYVRKKLPFGEFWLEDVVQEIWMAFFIYASKTEIRKEVSNLLWTIARNKRADAIDRLSIERKIEKDIPLDENISSAEKAAIDRPFEASLWKKEQQRFVRQIPFIEGLLTDCQRVLWILKEHLGYPPSAISRLMGKKTQTVYSALSYARKCSRKRAEQDPLSANYALGFFSQTLKRAAYYEPTRSATMVLERFLNPTTPQFTPEELKPLGLTAEEVQSDFYMSLLLPWVSEEDREMNIGPIVLLLTEKTDWPILEKAIERLSLNPDNPYVDLRDLQYERMRARFGEDWMPNQSAQPSDQQSKGLLIDRPIDIETTSTMEFFRNTIAYNMDVFPYEYLVHVYLDDNNLDLHLDSPIKFVPDVEPFVDYRDPTEEISFYLLMHSTRWAMKVTGESPEYLFPQAAANIPATFPRT